MPNRKSVPSLRNCCIREIATNIKQIENQVAKLPYNFINELYHRRNQLSIDYSKLNPKVFINPCTTELNLSDLLSPSADKFMKLIQQHLSRSFNQFLKKRIKKICQVCKHLKSINFGDSKQITIHIQTQLIQTFPHIQYLNLTKLCTNHILLTIGHHCKRLRSLNISSSFQVTDKGIINLCKYKQPKIISFDIRHTNVTPDGCLHALNNVQLLTSFQNDQWDQIFQILNHNFNLNQHLIQYNLQFLPLNYTLNQRNLNIVTIAFPKVCNLNLSNSANLNVIVSKNHFRELTILSIFNDNVDIRLLAIFCPLLTILKLSIQSENFYQSKINDLLVNSDVRVKQFSFRHLCVVSIGCVNGVNIPKDYLNLLLGSCCKLDALYFTNCHVISDEFIRDFVKLNRLRRLRRFCLKSCHSISIEGLMMLLEMDIPLEIIVVNHCRLVGDVEQRQLVKYVRCKNLNVQVEVLTFQHL